MNKVNEIKRDIENINERIYSKRKLLEKYPNDKGLLLSLESFEKRKEHLYFLLENRYDKLFKKLIQALEMNNNVYTTDNKEIYQNNKDQMWLLNNDELIDICGKEIKESSK